MSSGSNPFGWGGVNRDGLRMQRGAGGGKKGGGCKGKAKSLLFWFTVSLTSIGYAVDQSLWG